MRRQVLANAFEEETEPCPHSELWLRFVQGMGATESATGAPNPEIPEIAGLMNTFKSIAANAPIAAAFGALFAYESQVPRIASEKLGGLKAHYGADDHTCSYFALHMKADVHHSGVWRKIISALIEQDERHAAEALEGVSQAARALAGLPWTGSNASGGQSP